MINLKVVINGIVEGVRSYSDLSIETNSRVIESVRLAVKGAAGAIKEVRANQKKGLLWKYLKGYRDREIITDAIEVLQAALDSMMTKISLAIQGAIRG